MQANRLGKAVLFGIFTDSGALHMLCKKVETRLGYISRQILAHVQLYVKYCQCGA